MNKEKRNLAIAVTLIVFVAVGVYYYQRANKQDHDEVLPAGQYGQEEGGTQAVLESDNTANGVQVQNQAFVNAADLNEVRFNEAIRSAQLASRNKDYRTAISKYNLALSYKVSDVAYAGLFNVYSAQNEWVKAESVLDKAIKLNPSLVDFWKTKIGIAFERNHASYNVLEDLYKEGLEKVNPKTKIDLVTYFAGVAEKNGRISSAISLWQYAQRLYPPHNDMYQSEIDRLRSL